MKGEMEMAEFMSQPVVPKESQVQTAILRYLNGVGIFAFRVNNGGVYRGRRGGKNIYSFNGILGVSDIISCLPPIVMGSVRSQGIPSSYGGVICCIEVKRPGKLNNQSDGQRDFQEQIEKNKGIYLLVDSYEMLDNKFKELGIIK